MQLPDYIVRQLAKPTGFLGRFILWRLKSANSQMNAIALNALAIQSHDQVLEIGFGSGTLLEQIIDRAPRMVAGVEISQLAINTARRRFRWAVKNGTLHLATIDGDQIPYAASAFSKICCVNVVYFWDDPVAMLHEIHRVLRPEGQFVVCYQPVGPNARQTPPNWLEDHLRTAGFRNLATVANRDDANGDFFCTTAGKP